MKLADLLKQSGVAEEVIKGLTPEISSAIETHLTAADTKIQNATQLEQQAAELRRIAELEKKETHEYVEKYGQTLTKTANVEAENAALKTYLEKLKAQGFEIEIPGAEGGGKKPLVPGSPAEGGNAPVDEKVILNKVGAAVGTVLNLNNEYMRLYGAPMPDNIDALFEEAKRNKYDNVAEYAAKKYKFEEKRQELATTSKQKELEEYANKRLDEFKRKQAEENGGNPNLRPGVSSQNSFVPKIKGDEFHKSDGNVPQRERMRRLTENIHRDIAASRDGAA